MERTERDYGAFLGLQIFPSADDIDLLARIRPLIEAAIEKSKISVFNSNFSISTG